MERRLRRRDKAQGVAKVTTQAHWETASWELGGTTRHVRNDVSDTTVHGIESCLWSIGCLNPNDERGAMRELR